MCSDLYLASLSQMGLGWLLSPPLTGSRLREAFFNCLSWTSSDRPSDELFTFTLFYVLRGTDRLPCALVSS